MNKIILSAIILIILSGQVLGQEESDSGSVGLTYLLNKMDSLSDQVSNSSTDNNRLHIDTREDIQHSINNQYTRVLMGVVSVYFFFFFFTNTVRMFWDYLKNRKYGKIERKYEEFDKKISMLDHRLAMLDGYLNRLSGLKVIEIPEKKKKYKPKLNTTSIFIIIFGFVVLTVIYRLRIGGLI